MKMLNNTCFCIGALASAVGLSVNSYANESASYSVLEEIVVSARRTEENMQSVPVSANVFDNKTLRENSITSTLDLQYSIPGVNLAGTSPQNVVYMIRGQSKALAGFSSPAVVSYFAEVPEPVFGSSVPQFDMENIQVLKGPQGTMFGRNTTGGAILYSPVAPSHELGGFFGGTLGDENHRRVQGAVNIPLIQDKVALRVAGDLNRRDGYTKNIGVGGDLDGVDTESYRISLLIEPTDYIRNTFIYDHFKSDNDGHGIVLEDVFSNPSLLDSFGIRDAALEELALQKERGPFVNDPSFAQFEKNERTSITNRTEIDFGSIRVINIFGYRQTDLSYAVNTDALPTLNAFGFLPVNFIKASLAVQVEQYSNELQVRGEAFEEKLDWMLGGFWLKSEPDGGQGNAVAFAPEFIGASGASYGFNTERSQAVFANFRYDLSDLVVEGLGLEMGVRYTEDEIEVCTGTGATPYIAGVQGAPDEASLSDCESGNADKILATSVNKTKSNATTWSVGLNWQINDDVFAYLVNRHGYRAGGINAPTLSGRLTPYQSFEPETVTDYEVGLRADWTVGDMLLRTNVSAYIGEYEDVQVNQGGVQTAGTCDEDVPGGTDPGKSPDGDCDPSNDPAGGSLLLNLGETEVSGVDLEIILIPIEGLTINLGGSYIDTETKSISKPAGLEPYITSNEVAFNFTAQKSLTAGIRYAKPLASIADEMVVNLDYYWTDKAVRAELFIPSYDITNFRLDLNGVANSSVDLGFFVRNLFDQENAVTAVAGNTSIGILATNYSDPRMWGFDARYNF